MALIPGSKNDLLQVMENAPEMRQQRDNYLRTLAAMDDARRRVISEQDTPGEAPEVPTYVLPDTN